MSIRENTIMQKLSGLLKRRTPPQAIRNDPELQREEAMSLLRCILRFAPRENYDEWWQRFEDRLLGNAQTYSWPHAGDIAKVGASLQEKQSGQSQITWEPDPLQIAAKRMNASDPVGDEWIYGIRAVQLLKAGVISHDTMRGYRSALFFRMKELHGGDIARKLESEMIERHEQSESHNRKWPKSGKDTEVQLKKFGGVPDGI